MPDPQTVAAAVRQGMYARDHAAQALGIAVDQIEPGADGQRRQRVDRERHDRIRRERSLRAAGGHVGGANGCCSVSSVYRILRRAGALVARPRRPKPVWTRYQKAVPGERAQMDLKYLPQGRFQLTLVDDCSRMVAATVLTRRTSAAVCEALPGLLAALPFPLRCIQTDNGPEFGLALTRLLEAHGIRHARIRPHTPRLNGKVERVQRTMAEELWDHLAPGSLAAWQRQLERYLRFYNQRRPHSALGYQAPLGYARDRLPAGPDVSHMS
jgi:transposase InsO family protein